MPKIKNYDASSHILRNIKELKTLEFQVQNLVTEGINHLVVTKNQVHHIDLIEGTHSFVLVEAKQILSPIELHFRYNKDQHKDVKVIYSKIHRVPHDSNS